MNLSRLTVPVSREELRHAVVGQELGEVVHALDPRVVGRVDMDAGDRGEHQLALIGLEDVHRCSEEARRADERAGLDARRRTPPGADGPEGAVRSDSVVLTMLISVADLVEEVPERRPLLREATNAVATSRPSESRSASIRWKRRLNPSSLDRLLCLHGVPAVDPVQVHEGAHELGCAAGSVAGKSVW